MGNPYGPDLPPINNTTWKNTHNPYPNSGGPVGVGNRFLDVNQNNTFTHELPRLWPTTDQVGGGYFIDQNSGWPTKKGDDTYLDESETAGICTLCHGSDVDNLDYYDNATAATKLWRTGQVNGHANSTVGGTGRTDANARNIFDGISGNNGVTDRTIASYMSSQDGINNGNYGEDFTALPFWGDTMRSGHGNGPAQPASNSPPKVTGWYGGTIGSTTRSAGDYSRWYSNNNTLTTTDSIGLDGSPGSTRAHSFTCSKCHSPHASDLPALLITNCLDLKTADWAETDPSGRVLGPTATGSGAVTNRTTCHEKGTTTRDSGWNYLAPGQ